MIEVAKMQLRYGLRKKVFVRRNMMLEEDVLSIAKAIIRSEDDIKNGRLISGEEALEELRQKYGY